MMAKSKITVASSGLSMAMDLIDLSHKSQASLFETEQLSAIMNVMDDHADILSCLNLGRYSEYDYLI
ncbi:hypothetical protein DM01DRAFT_1338031 [Hesseltinella vesiculosa]|uniref:Uncharacterized protein n=1 Tax=Hesseltinella vesiculosa TaxID=101127 RepID=A0A1X2GBJ2_9FUNG|nr:hypothetical protein DM01DRAFT_1338031 [Hesseltinella vesiculosa]